MPINGPTLISIASKVQRQRRPKPNKTHRARRWPLYLGVAATILVAVAGVYQMSGI
jgi:hypothetical protein